MLMTHRTSIKPSSDFYWGALAMKSAMLATCDVHLRDIELGFPPEIVLDKLRENLELLTAEMVADLVQNIGEKTG
jgi:hypothetical protein